MADETRVLFTRVSEENRPDVPMCETGFWQFLEWTEESHSIIAKREYLASIGYDKEVHYIEEEVFKTLDAIMSHFWYLKVREEK